MNFQLLWMDFLLVALLWVAASAAWVGRVKRTWLRVCLSSLAALAPLAVLGLCVAGAATMKFGGHIETNWFGYALSLFLVFVAGTWLILHQAGRREPGLPAAAATWPRVLLALAWLMAVAVGYMVLLNMDLAVRARCAIQSAEINSLYLATLPAITSDAQNAAPVYENAYTRLRADPPKDISNPPYGDAVNFNPNEPTTVAFLRRHTATISLLRRAAALPGCRFDQDLLDPGPDIEMTLSSLAESRQAANLLNLHARLEIARGHASSAIADAEAILCMSRHVGQRPLLISVLTGVGLGAMGNRTLQEALPAVTSRNELSGLDLNDLTSFGRLFQQSLRGEERFGLAVYGNAPEIQLVKATASPQVQDTYLLASGSGIGGAVFRVFVLDSNDYIQLMEDLQNSITNPYYKVRNQLTNSLNRSHGLLTSILVPALSRAIDNCATVEASDACARTAVAMTRFRLDHAVLPSHLDDLVPAYLDAIPIDPFDGHPLRLAIKNNEWIIYSVGPDGIDNGGAELDHGNGKGDVTFILKPARTGESAR